MSAFLQVDNSVHEVVPVNTTAGGVFANETVLLRNEEYGEEGSSFMEDYLPHILSVIGAAMSIGAYIFIRHKIRQIARRRPDWRLCLTETPLGRYVMRNLLLTPEDIQPDNTDSADQDSTGDEDNGQEQRHESDVASSSPLMEQV